MEKNVKATKLGVSIPVRGLAGGALAGALALSSLTGCTPAPEAPSPSHTVGAASATPAPSPRSSKTAVPSTPNSSARASAVKACEAIRDTVVLDNEKLVAGQEHALELASAAADEDSSWQQFYAHMKALTDVPIPQPDDANPDWKPRLDAYFLVANTDCLPLGVSLPQG